MCPSSHSSGSPRCSPAAKTSRAGRLLRRPAHCRVQRTSCSAARSRSRKHCAFCWQRGRLCAQHHRTCGRHVRESRRCAQASGRQAQSPNRLRPLRPEHQHHLRCLRHERYPTLPLRTDVRNVIDRMAAETQRCAALIQTGMSAPVAQNSTRTVRERQFSKGLQVSIGSATYSTTAALMPRSTFLLSGIYIAKVVLRSGVCVQRAARRSGSRTPSRRPSCACRIGTPIRHRRLPKAPLQRRSGWTAIVR